VPAVRGPERLRCLYCATCSVVPVEEAARKVDESTEEGREYLELVRQLKKNLGYRDAPMTLLAKENKAISTSAHSQSPLFLRPFAYITSGCGHGVPS